MKLNAFTHWWKVHSETMQEVSRINTWFSSVLILQKWKSTHNLLPGIISFYTFGSALLCFALLSNSEDSIRVCQVMQIKTTTQILSSTLSLQYPFYPRFIHLKCLFLFSLFLLLFFPSFCLHMLWNPSWQSLGLCKCTDRGCWCGGVEWPWLAAPCFIFLDHD